MNLVFSKEAKTENTVNSVGFAHTKLNLLFLEKRKKAEQRSVRTEFRIADVGRLPVSDEALCTVLNALFDDAVRIAAESERKYMYAAVLVRSGQFLVSIKSGAGKLSTPNDIAALSSLNRPELAEIKNLSEKIGGNFVCSGDNGMLCYTFCLGLLG